MPKKTKKEDSEILKRLSAIEKNQKEMMAMQKKIFEKETELESEELSELNAERILQQEEVKELEELEKIEKLEEELSKNIGGSPLKKITYRDVTKGILGAFIGIVGHFAFAKGVELSEHYTYLRSTLLLVTSFVIIILFLYFAGFRTINDKFIFKILPVRAIVIYISALLTVVIVLLLYGKIDFTTPFSMIYNTVAAISILAVLGAGTADLIGRNEE